MRTCIVVLLLVMSNILYGQSEDPIPGAYSGFYNGDNISLSIDKPQGSVYTGVMKDSYQTFGLSMTRSGSHLKGTATEASLGLVLNLSGTQSDGRLDLLFEMEYQGQQASMQIAFSKAGVMPQAGSATGQTMLAPANAEYPASLLGTWTREELYQSGIGDSGMSAGFSESLTLLQGGEVAEAGSNAYISGSNYSGQSTGGSQGIIPGLRWYAVGNQLYIIVTENGQTQTHLLGRYYIEGSKMLITGANGEKTLLHRN